MPSAVKRRIASRAVRAGGIRRAAGLRAARRLRENVAPIRSSEGRRKSHRRSRARVYSKSWRQIQNFVGRNGKAASATALNRLASCVRIPLFPLICGNYDESPRDAQPVDFQLHSSTASECPVMCWQMSGALGMSLFATNHFCIRRKPWSRISSFYRQFSPCFFV